MESYEIIKHIANGSFGEVFLGRSRIEKTEYIIKKIKLNTLSKQERESTEQEVALLSSLKHPCIVSYKDSFIQRVQEDDQTNDYLLIIMENCEFGDIHKNIKDRKYVPYSESQILEWLIQLCLSLDYLQVHSILHRDIKTQNLFIAKYDEKTKFSLLKLGDFGVSKLLDNSNEFASTQIGTPYYLSPEIFLGKPYSFFSDIWSLGCCVVEMLVGKQAFSASSLSSLGVKIVKGDYSQISNVSQKLRELVKKMLSVNPNERPLAKDILLLPWVRRKVKIVVERIIDCTPARRQSTVRLQLIQQLHRVGLAHLFGYKEINTNLDSVTDKRLALFKQMRRYKNQTDANIQELNEQVGDCEDAIADYQTGRLREGQSSKVTSSELNGLNKVLMAPCRFHNNTELAATEANDTISSISTGSAAARKIEALKELLEPSIECQDACVETQVNNDVNEEELPKPDPKEKEEDINPLSESQQEMEELLHPTLVRQKERERERRRNEELANQIRMENLQRIYMLRHGSGVQHSSKQFREITGINLEMTYAWKNALNAEQKDERKNGKLVKENYNEEQIVDSNKEQWEERAEYGVEEHLLPPSSAVTLPVDNKKVPFNSSSIPSSHSPSVRGTVREEMLHIPGFTGFINKLEKEEKILQLSPARISPTKSCLPPVIYASPTKKKIGATNSLSRDSAPSPIAPKYSPSLALSPHQNKNVIVLKSNKKALAAAKSPQRIMLSPITEIQKPQFTKDIISNQEKKKTKNEDQKQMQVILEELERIKAELQQEREKNKCYSIKAQLEQEERRISPARPAEEQVSDEVAGVANVVSFPSFSQASKGLKSQKSTHNAKYKGESTDKNLMEGNLQNVDSSSEKESDSSSDESYEDDLEEYAIEESEVEDAEMAVPEDEHMEEEVPLIILADQNYKNSSERSSVARNYDIPTNFVNTTKAFYDSSALNSEELAVLQEFFEDEETLQKAAMMLLKHNIEAANVRSNKLGEVDSQKSGSLSNGEAKSDLQERRIILQQLKNSFVKSFVESYGSGALEMLPKLQKLTASIAR